MAGKMSGRHSLFLPHFVVNCSNISAHATIGEQKIKMAKSVGRRLPNTSPLCFNQPIGFPLNVAVILSIAALN